PCARHRREGPGGVEVRHSSESWNLVAFRATSGKNEKRDSSFRWNDGVMWMTDDPFLLTLLPTTHDLGGFKVHRTLPHRERTTVGPFIFFDQMGPAHLEVGNGMDV